MNSINIKKCIYRKNKYTIIHYEDDRIINMATTSVEGIDRLLGLTLSDYLKVEPFIIKGSRIKSIVKNGKEFIKLNNINNVKLDYMN